MKTVAPQNYAITLYLSDLTQPERLYPSKKLYVVWIDTKGDNFKIIGLLKMERGRLANSLISRFNAITPFKPFKVFITAEDTIQVQNPGKQIILQTRIFYSVYLMNYQRINHLTYHDEMYQTVKIYGYYPFVSNTCFL